MRYFIYAVAAIFSLAIVEAPQSKLVHAIAAGVMISVFAGAATILQFPRPEPVPKSTESVLETVAVEILPAAPTNGILCASGA